MELLGHALEVQQRLRTLLRKFATWSNGDKSTEQKYGTALTLLEVDTGVVTCFRASPCSESVGQRATLRIVGLWTASLIAPYLSRLLASFTWMPL